MGLTIDDEWENGPMIRRAGIPAFGLYCAAGLWIARHTTDGFIPADVAADLGTREWSAKLVTAGFWKVVEGGFQDVHYLRLNPSADKVAERRRREAERKARWRDRKSGRTNELSSISRRDVPRDNRHVPQDNRDVPRDSTRDKTRDATREGGPVPLGRDAGATLSPAASPPGRQGRAPAHARGAARAPTGHVASCPYQERDPATCGICASERKAAPDQDLEPNP
jgi:hypothetical protein